MRLPVAVLLFATAAVSAQVRETVTVSVVEVPVTVVDRDGRRVARIPPADRVHD
jgi:hypothetical protein